MLWWNRVIAENLQYLWNVRQDTTRSPI